MKALEKDDKRRNKLKPIKIVQFGVGPIGAEVVKYALKKQGTRIVGAVDIDVNKQGQQTSRASLRDRSSRVWMTVKRLVLISYSTGSLQGEIRRNLPISRVPSLLIESSHS